MAMRAAALATAPAACPPMPSATMISCSASSIRKLSSLLVRTGPISVMPKATPHGTECRRLGESAVQGFMGLEGLSIVMSLVAGLDQKASALGQGCDLLGHQA